MKKYITIITLLICVQSFGSGLQDYKKQKHGKRKRVTESSCIKDYVRSCQSKCSSNDKACKRLCVSEAPSFCKKRKSRRRSKVFETALKGASVFAGAVAVAFDDDMAKVTLGKDGLKLSPYTVFWNKSSHIAVAKAGMVEAGAKSAGAEYRYRNSWYGIGAKTEHLWDNDITLTETAIGPGFSFGSASMIFTAQPSLLISSGNDVETEYGYGVQSYTDIYSGRVIGNFDVMLGNINNNWNYHARFSLGYRIDPNMAIMGGYEYRDVVDLDDLDISQATLQSVMAYFQWRIN